MEMACSAPLAMSYSAALTSTSSIVGRHRVTAVGSTGGCSRRNDVRFNRNGQVQGPECGSKGSLFKPGVISSGKWEATVAKATESAVGVGAAVEDHTTDPNEIFLFDLVEYESTNGPVCLTSFVPKYDSSHFEEPAAPETEALLVSDEPALAEPETPLVVAQPSPAEVAAAEITSELVAEMPLVVPQAEITSELVPETPLVVPQAEITSELVPETPLVVPEPSPAEVAPAEITSELVPETLLVVPEPSAAAEITSELVPETPLVVAEPSAAEVAAAEITSELVPETPLVVVAEPSAAEVAAAEITSELVPETPVVVPQPSPAEVSAAEITSELVPEEPAVVQAIEAEVSERKSAPPPRPQSPFSRYPDLRPPSSPTPSSPPAKVSATSQQTVVVEAPEEVESPDAALVTAAQDPVAPPTPPESRRVESLPWIPLKPQSPYARFPDLKPPASPTPRPPSL